ncbi:hypothetical protein [Streptomyces sp. NPDC057702]|uniref:hypothetical protein n=1 Tax=unclassified Streptomyces TaxID=2593676 RepID=UPI0036CA33E8
MGEPDHSPEPARGALARRLGRLRGAYADTASADTAPAARTASGGDVDTAASVGAAASPHAPLSLDAAAPPQAEPTGSPDAARLPAGRDGSRGSRARPEVAGPGAPAGATELAGSAALVGAVGTVAAHGTSGAGPGAPEATGAEAYEVAEAYRAYEAVTAEAARSRGTNEAYGAAAGRPLVAGARGEATGAVTVGAPAAGPPAAGAAAGGIAAVPSPATEPVGGGTGLAAAGASAPGDEPGGALLVPGTRDDTLPGDRSPQPHPHQAHPGQPHSPHAHPHQAHPAQARAGGAVGRAPVGGDTDRGPFGGEPGDGPASGGPGRVPPGGEPARVRADDAPWRTPAGGGAGVPAECVAPVAGTGPRGRAVGSADPLAGRARLAAPTVARPAVEHAVRALADDAATGLPWLWAKAVREVAQGAARGLPEALDEVVAEIGDRAVNAPGRGGSLVRRPRWWAAATLAQRVCLAAQLVGLLWLVAVLAGLVGGSWWVPTALLVSGWVVGSAMARLCAWAARGPARQHGEEAERRLREAVADCGRERVLEAVLAELARYRQVRERYVVASGGA